MLSSKTTMHPNISMAPRHRPMSRKTSAKGGGIRDKEQGTREKKPFSADVISLAFRLEVLTISAFCMLVLRVKWAQSCLFICLLFCVKAKRVSGLPHQI